MKKKPSNNRRRSKSSFLKDGLESLAKWQARWEHFDADATLQISPGQMGKVLDTLVKRLNDNYPFFHPRYAGQMMKPPHPVASIAYFLAQQINPNNHALDGGPATAKMELEAIAQLAKMFGYETHLGHLTSSGTIANLEALWVARSLHPDKTIAFSAEAHYTHRRMCDVIGARSVEIGVDGRGRMDLQDLQTKLKSGNIGTVVMTAGTTGLGAVDPIDKILDLQREFGFRIHVDAAYGGFFRLMTEVKGLLEEDVCRAFRAIRFADSVVVDPHKHGLQPYGCGSVIFREPSVGKLYKHDSPYTYFTSKELHLGEISLECSRAGASAAALWATLQCFPLRARKGLGAVLMKTRQAALAFTRTMEKDEKFRMVTEPDLDIVNYFVVGKDKRVSAISRTTARMFDKAMNRTANPLYLAKIILKPGVFARHSDLVWDEPTVTVFRSVLMKPEHLGYISRIHEQLSKVAKEEGIVSSGKDGMHGIE